MKHQSDSETIENGKMTLVALSGVALFLFLLTAVTEQRAMAAALPPDTTSSFPWLSILLIAGYILLISVAMARGKSWAFSLMSISFGLGAFVRINNGLQLISASSMAPQAAPFKMVGILNIVFALYLALFIALVLKLPSIVAFVESVDPDRKR